MREAHRFPRLSDEAQWIKAYAAVRWMAEKARRLGIHEEATVARELEQTRLTLLEAAYRRNLAQTITPNPIDLKKEVQRLEQHQIDRPRKRLRVIFKEVPAHASDEKTDQIRSEIESLRRRALRGEPFSDLARAHSDSSNRYVGGLVGLIDLQRLAPSLRASAEPLGDGEMSSILRTDQGWVLLMCEQVVEPSQQSQSELIAQAEGQFRQRMLKPALELDRQAIIERIRIHQNGSDSQAVVSVEGVDILRYELSASEMEVIESGAGSIGSRVQDALVQRVRARRMQDDGIDAELQSRLDFAAELTLATAYFERIKVSKTVQYSDEAVQRFIDANPQMFIGPRMCRISLIMIQASDDSKSPDVFRKMQQIRTQLAEGTLAFEAAAKHFSDHDSASNGGDVGWQSASQIARWGPIVYRVVEDLAQGEISDVIQDRLRFWLIRLNEENPAKPLPYDESAKRCRQMMARQEGLSLLDQIREQMAEESQLSLITRIKKP